MHADQVAIANFDGPSIPSLVGTTSTTLRSVGIVVALVAIIALGKTASFASARIESQTGDVVPRTNHIEHVVVSSHSSVVLRSEENLPLDSNFAEPSDSDEETEVIDRMFHDIFPPPGHNENSYTALDQDQNHYIHLAGSQFGLDGLPSVRRGVRVPSSRWSSAASLSSESFDAGSGTAQLDEIRMIADSCHSPDFDYTCNSLRDDESVSVASMAVLFDQDESQDFP
ncbi:hypothetical protein PG994_002529 [Apiospora phragmitis]|uniref:Uncharacterized protein n=1 Tax=Apiospora phragmitis TaxID=2905665 RepID=A0ABR1W5E7_9PEZI